VSTIALATDETLLILKIAFLVLLYAFILYVVRSATRDIGGAPQESIILGAAEAAELRAEYGVQEQARAAARFLILDGPGKRKGDTIELTAATVLGRDRRSDVRLDDDEFASAQHARIEPRSDGTWVEDLGSTNGTFVNGERITAERLKTGDVVRVGQTELRLES
jgi:pSer/pThr/pTyr-binding forkhead associated (FHA) protein